MQQYTDMQGRVLIEPLLGHEGQMRFCCTKESAAETVKRVQVAKSMLPQLEHAFSQVQSWL